MKYKKTPDHNFLFPFQPTIQNLLTHNETDFTVLVIIATGHHGPNCVIHHSHNVNIKVLWGNHQYHRGLQM